MKKLFVLAFLLHLVFGNAQTTLDSLVKLDPLFMEELMTSPLPGISIGADYPGGINNFQIDLREKLSKASIKKLSRLKQNSRLNFTVQKDGSLADISIFPSNDKKLIKDIQRSIKLMPKWSPAIENGKAYSSKISLPIIPENFEK